MNRQIVTETKTSKNSTPVTSSEHLQRKRLSHSDINTKLGDINKKINAPTFSARIADSQNSSQNFNYDFSVIPVKQNALPAIQAKLTIGQPNDKYEREADRVADEIMKMSEQDSMGFPIRQAADAKMVRRTPVSPFSMAEGRIVEEDEDEVQAKVDNGVVANAESAISSVNIKAAISRSGTALPDSTRAIMENRFGYNFSQVRIHSDTLANKAAKSINARAFTKGADIAFAHGQYAPDSPMGRQLLAHELTHVVQQGKAQAYLPTLSFRPTIKNNHGSLVLQRMNWGTARDTGRDSLPWGTGPRGDIYEAETDSGTKINVWKPHNGSTYWCHGYTFGGATVSGGPFSIWGQNVPTVLADDGWNRAFSCVAQTGDILVFTNNNNVAHTGIIYSTFEPGGIVDEKTSMLDSKWGQLPLNRRSWKLNAKQYGTYSVFSKNLAYGPCAGKGAEEQ